MQRFLNLIAIPVLALLTTTAAAQDLRHTWSEAFRRPALDVAIDSDVIWIADGYGVTLATRQNPPALISTKSFPGTTSLVTMEGGSAWIISGTTLFRASWNGESVLVESARDLGEEVYDIVGARGYLYLATPSGVVQIDTAIQGSRNVLATTNGPAISLATDGNTLLAADGDKTIEVYEIQFPVLPQKIGTAEHTIAGANRVFIVDDTLLVSNGRESQLFAGLRPPFTSLGKISFGAATAAVSSPGIVFAAGQDTTVRAVDLRLSAGRPSIVFEERIPPSEGTINRISRIRSDGNFVYVAAGDMGLRTYDIVGFGTPFPLVRSFVDRADSVVDLGTGQIVAARRDGVPRLYGFDDSGALREVARWDAVVGVTLLDHWREVTIVADGGRVRLVRPSAAVTGQFSFNAAITSGVVVGDTLWVTLFDRTLWRVPLPAGPPARVDVAGANPSWIARGDGRLILGSLNNDGKTTIHELDQQNPSASPSMTINGLATSGGAAGSGVVAVATFRGLSLLDIDDGANGTERVYSLGEGMVPRSLEIANDEVIVLGTNTVHRRSIADGSLIDEIRLLSPSLSINAEDGASRVVVGATEGVYVINLETSAVLPVALEPLDELLFYDDVVASDGVVHLVENESIHSRLSLNQSLAAEISVRTFDGDLVDVTAVEAGFCGVDSLGRVDCFDGAGRFTGGDEITALPDATFLSIDSVRDAVMVSLLEGCFKSGCRKRTVFGTIGSGMFQPGGEIEGEVVAIDRSAGRFVVVTELPRQVRVYDIAASSASPELVSSIDVEEQYFSVAIDQKRGVVYLAGNRVRALALPTLADLGEVLGPLSPSSGFTGRDQGIEIEGDHAIVIGRSSSVHVYRIDGPSSWTLERTIPLPSTPRRMVRDGSTIVILTDFSVELLDTAPRPTRRRTVR